MPKSQPPRKRNAPANKRPSEKTQKRRENKEQWTSMVQDLKEADNASREMLQAVAKFSPYLMNEKLVNHGDREQIHNYSAILSRDSIQMRQELDALWMEIPSEMDPDNEDDVSKAINIGARYNEWQERYERVITPTIDQLSSLLEEAAKGFGQSDEIAEAQFEEVDKGDSNE